MVDWDNREISIKRQAELLGIHRTNVYRQREPRHEPPENVQLMHEIDKLYTKHPFYGYRRRTAKVQEQGWAVNRKRVQRLMRLMGIEAIYPGPNLSKRYQAQYIRPSISGPTCCAASSLIVRIRFGGSILRIYGWAKALCTCL